MYIVFLALRFLRSRLVNLIAVGGVMVGVAVLIVVTSVMDGFRVKVLSTIRGNLSDVIMTPMTGSGEKLPDFDTVAGALMEDPRIEAVAPRFEHQVFYLWRSNSRAVLRMGDYAVFPMRAVGIDWERERKASAIEDYLVAANREEDPFFSQRKVDWYKEGSVMVSRTFAQNYMGVSPGKVELPHDNPDVLDMYATFLEMEPKADESMPAFAERLEAAYAERQNPFQMILETDVGITFADVQTSGDPNASGGSLKAGWRTYQLPVAAVYDGRDTSMDADRLYYDIDTLRRLAHPGVPLEDVDAYNSIRVKLKDPDEARAVQEDLKGRHPEFSIMVWQDLRQGFLKAVNNEKVMLAIVLSFIVMLGGFIILATLTLTVVEKTKDIGVIAALGATRTGVLSLFVGNGLLIGAVGAVLGVGLGRLVVDHANNIKDSLYDWFGIDIFPSDIYWFREIPTVWDWSVVGSVAAGSIITAFIAGLIPAWRAARMDPVKALRYE